MLAVRPGDLKQDEYVLNPFAITMQKFRRSSGWWQGMRQLGYQLEGLWDKETRPRWRIILPWFWAPVEYLSACKTELLYNSQLYLGPRWQWRGISGWPKHSFQPQQDSNQGAIYNRVPKQNADRLRVQESQKVRWFIWILIRGSPLLCQYLSVLFVFL